MTIKQYRNNYKDMHPNTAQHVGREIMLATMMDSSADILNDRLVKASITNPDGTNVVFSAPHLSQMKAGICNVFDLVQTKAPHRFSEALELVVNMHTGGAYGPWYRRWYIPHALKTGAPLWIPSSDARKIVTELRGDAELTD